MFRVIVADDEERICNLILALVNWQQLGLEVVSVAHNGQEAIDMIKAHRPDILITDIRMPGYDGLTLINKAKAILPQLEIIIISGYAQFDYAQAALRNGVSEYLLKPINREVLNQTLSKMVDALCQRRQEECDIASMQKFHQGASEQLRKKLLLDLLYAQQSLKDRQQLAQMYSFACTSDTFVTFVLQVDYGNTAFTDASKEIVQRKSLDLCAQIKSVCTDAILDYIGGTLIAVVNLPHVQFSALRNRLRSILNQLVAEKNIYGGVDFSLALGPCCEEATQIQASLFTARRVISERLIDGTGRMLEEDVSRSGVLEADYQTRYAQAIVHAIDTLSLVDADKAVNILLEATAYPYVHGWELIEIVRSAAQLLLPSMGLEDGHHLLSAFSKEIENCASIDALFSTLREWQQAQLSKTIARNADRDAQPIRNAKIYIHKHFSSPITLEEVSSAIGFSVNYFSTMFKKETGEGFAKYLIRLRMDEARNLLRETNASVAEVCTRVGYVDVKHFVKTFKAETGLTPGEYRKIYG